MPRSKSIPFVILFFLSIIIVACSERDKTPDQKLTETREYYNSPGVIGAFMDPVAFGKYRWHATFTIKNPDGKTFDETEYLIRNSRFTPKTTILDWGCGMGWLAVYLAKRCQCQVTGLNISVRQLEQARKWAIQNQVQHLVHFDLYDGKKLPYADATFDIVYSQEALVHAPNKDLAYREIFRVIKPGGEFSIQDWYADGKNPDWQKLVKPIDDEHKSTLTTMQNVDALLTQTGFQSVQTQDVRELAPDQLNKAFPNRAFADSIRQHAFTVGFTSAQKPSH